MRFNLLSSFNFYHNFVPMGLVFIRISMPPPGSLLLPSNFAS